MKAFTFEDGAFASLARLDGRVYLCYQTDPRSNSSVKVVDLAIGSVAFSKVIGEGAAFPLVHAFDGRLLVAWRNGTSGVLTLASVLADPFEIDLEPAAGNEPFAFEGPFLYWQALDYQIKRTRIVGAPTIDTSDQRGVGTGIARVVNGRAILRDYERHYKGLTFPAFTPGYAVCEGRETGNVVFRDADETQAVVWPGLECFAPKILDNADGVFVATYGSGSVRAAAVQGFDFEQPPALPPPPPQPPPPQPQPPEPPAMSEKLPDPVKASRDRYVMRYPVPQGSMGDAFEEQARQWSIALSQQVHSDTGDARWGMKNAGGGRPTSKDTLAFYVGDGRIRIWDLLNGTGTGHPTLVADPSSEDIGPPQEFLPQPAINHVGGASQPPADPPVDPPHPHDPPPAAGDWAAVVAELKQLNATMAQIAVVLGD